LPSVSIGSSFHVERPYALTCTHLSRDSLYRAFSKREKNAARRIRAAFRAPRRAARRSTPLVGATRAPVHRSLFPPARVSRSRSLSHVASSGGHATALPRYPRETSCFSVVGGGKSCAAEEGPRVPDYRRRRRASSPSRSSRSSSPSWSSSSSSVNRRRARVVFPSGEREIAARRPRRR